MSDTSSAAPAAPATSAPANTTPSPTAPTSANPSASPVQRATDEIMASLPKDTPEVEDTGEDLPPEEPAKMTAAEKKAWKLKVAGKDVEVDETELLKRAQMGYSADEKWQEAAKMRKQLENFVGLLQQDPEAALEKMGFNVDELAEKRIQRRIEEMKKSPEQLEKERIEKELQDLKSEREREKEEARQREIKQLQDKYAVELENEINGALDSNELGLPKSPYIVKRMADVMIYAIQNKVPNFTAKQALEIVQKEVLDELNQMYAVAPDEVFEKLVGKDRLNKYRRSKIKKAPKTATPSDIRPTGTKELQQTREDNKPKQKIKLNDFLKNLGSK